MYRAPHHSPRSRPFFAPAWVPKAQRLLTVLLVGVALLVAVAWARKGAFVHADEVRPELLQEPRQTETQRSPFEFDYAGETYVVRPVADYEIWGLVVSHNDTTGLGDIYHDESSVDTKDLCLIWGPNLERDDFRRAEYDSTSFTCWVRYPPGVTFDVQAISNNHLVTSDPSIRARIGGVRRGDQVHIRGSLVDYQAASNPRFWRQSSTTRADSGNGACEVVFVDHIEVLERGAPIWHAAFGFGLWTLLLLALAKLGIFVWEVVKPASYHRTDGPLEGEPFLTPAERRSSWRSPPGPADIAPPRDPDRRAPSGRRPK